MEFYHLRTFVAVAEEEHLTRAAERLGASLPAVSAHVRGLEEELGVPLFLRTPKGMRLTGEGRALLAEARLALSSLEAVRTRAGALRQDVTGVARIGLNNEAARMRVPELLAALTRRHPGVEIHLVNSSSPRILDNVRLGRLDLGFVYDNILEPGHEIEAMALEDVDMAVVGPTSWADRVCRADWEELARLPWVWFSERCPFQYLLESSFSCRDLALNKVMVGDNDATLRTLVAAGIGLTLLRKDDALEAEAAGEVCLWRREGLRLGLSLVHRRERADDRVIAAIVSAVTEVWGLPARRR
ncbi:transcriptional regulator, LysR family [Solidesulfovibrio carbinoliphilus subsp. oakridgensis]|uniref:Transcriptional regulator, LysR family n=1 Tax=Solidesulfovibrio carbinoliphilus subsp. oakridgensis TaxID=694327 RepID=G7Q8H6_9BACT|nr:LysR family transcriptional regulator [Solidesulfovibrio carbinoliphilus]EHJ48588.1 transcriptional regulator, LysR family [Solidesulfovibrio carbinoliphilus subsp. oakridgensis]